MTEYYVTMGHEAAFSGDQRGMGGRHQFHGQLNKCIDISYTNTLTGSTYHFSSIGDSIKLHDDSVDFYKGTNCGGTNITIPYPGGSLAKTQIVDPDDMNMVISTDAGPDSRALESLNNSGSRPLSLLAIVTLMLTLFLF